MRKTMIGENPGKVSEPGEWLELEAIASVEVSSEDPELPAESVFQSNTSGWRSTIGGEQTIRLVFDEPRAVHRIELSFNETERERTQEFTLRWSGPGSPLTDIVRQQWTFSPQGSTSELEDYRVDLSNVQVLELKLRPDIQNDAAATLSRWRVA